MSDYCHLCGIDLAVTSDGVCSSCSDAFPLKKKEAEGMKKDTTKTKQPMNEATIQALHKSIAHWNDICYGEDLSVGPEQCALCTVFRQPGWNTTNYCENCPVENHSGLNGCKGTPYNDYCEKRAIDGCTVDSADAAEAMLELLVSLLPKDSRGKYNVDVDNGCASPGRNINYCLVYGRLNISGITGITTDGRNAFPQAKYVWERVFDNQRKCKITSEALQGVRLRDIGMWPYSVPRAAFNWQWPDATKLMTKTPDGKCVTCGQVVKKKEVRYQVLYRSTCGDKGLGVSTEHYTNAGEFYSNTCGLTYIKMLSESAKEFDA